MKKGFTLIELLVVISIISLLSSIVLSSLNSARNKAKDAAAKAQAKSMQSQSSLFYNDNGTYTGLWDPGSPLLPLLSNLISVLDGTHVRGVGALGNYYYAAIQLKDGNMLCLDGTGIIEEVSAVGWNWPVGNFQCP